VASLAPEELPPDLFDQRSGQDEAVKTAYIDEMTIRDPGDGVGPVMIDDVTRSRLAGLPLPYVERQYRQWSVQQQRQQAEQEAAAQIERHDQETAANLVVMAKRRGKTLTPEQALAEVRVQRGAGSAAGLRVLLESIGAVQPKPDTRLTAERQRIEASLSEDAVKEARDIYEGVNRSADGKPLGMAPPTDEDVRIAAMKEHDPPGMWNKVEKKVWESARRKVAAWDAYQAALKSRRDGKQAAAGELYVPGGIGALIGQALEEALAEDEDERGGR